MRYETKINFAKRAKVSRQAIYNLLRDGKLVANNSGKLDVNNKTNKDYLSSKNEGKSPGNKTNKNKSIKESKVKNEQEKETNKTTPKDLDYSPDDLNTLSHTSVNKLKTIEQIRKIQVDTDEKRQVLIPRKEVQKLFSKLYMVDVNQWRTMGPSLSPEIASIIGTDDNEIMLEISNLIDKEVFIILKQIKRIINDFLKEQKAEEIK